MQATSPPRFTAPFRRIFTGVAIFLLICLVAVFGYLSAGWELSDAIYMVVITIFGVGYGEVQPITTSGLRTLTILVIVSGYAAVIYTIGGIVQMVIDGEIDRALGARRMTRGIEQMENHIIVCGFGRIGSMLALELASAGKSFVIVDEDEDRIRVAESNNYLVVLGNATEEETLERAGIRRASVLATVLSDDATNLYITITSRDLNPHLEIIARGETPAAEKKLRRCGASRVVMPAAIGASRMAHLITRPTAESLLNDNDTQKSVNVELAQIGLSLDELRVAAGSPLQGQTVGDIEIKGNQGFLIVAVRKQDGEVTLNPPPETPLVVGDVVIVVGHQDDLPMLAKRYVLAKKLIYRGTAVDV